MALCFFCTDLHGHVSRYEKLIAKISGHRPTMVFLGGDLLPHGFNLNQGFDDFIAEFLIPAFSKLRQKLGPEYPSIYLILGNDDARVNEHSFIEAESLGIWEYIHNKLIVSHGYTILGYAYVPPTPFMLKDWERYDVSRYADPGCIHPLDGKFSMPPPEGDIEYQTIQHDLSVLASGINPAETIMLFHSPPYQTSLDRAALDNHIVDHVPLDVHVGSIGIKRFIEEKQPLITLHGHIHESSRLTGQWFEYIGNTLAVNGSCDSPELSLVSFDPGIPGSIRRELI